MRRQRRIYLETRLLLDCARLNAGADAGVGARRRLEGLSAPGFDWTSLLHRAGRHGMLPLLWRYLQHNAGDAVPAPISAQLQAYCRNTALHNLFLANELLKVLKLLRENGIVALPYKGPTLALYAYGDLALRQFNDLDILLERRHVLAAKALLLRQGFVAQQRLRDGDDEQAHLDDDCQYNFYSPDGEFIVELHWRVRPQSFPCPLEMNDFLPHAVTVCVGDTAVPSLAPEDLLLVLCIHGAKHRWERINWISDVARLIQACPQLDWAQLTERATRLRMGRVLALGLLLAHDLQGAPLPQNILHCAVSNPVARSLARQVRHQLLLDADVQAAAPRRFLFQLMVREGAASQWRYVQLCCRDAHRSLLRRATSRGRSDS
jgi:hypothetical protein